MDPSQINQHMLESSNDASTANSSISTSTNASSMDSTQNPNANPSNRANLIPVQTSFGPIARAIVSPMPVDMSFLAMASPMAVNSNSGFPYLNALSSPQVMNMNQAQNMNHLQMQQMNAMNMNNNHNQRLQQQHQGFGSMELPDLPIIPQLPHGVNYQQMSNVNWQTMMDFNNAGFDQLPSFELPPDVKGESKVQNDPPKKKRGRKRKVSYL